MKNIYIHTVANCSYRRLDAQRFRNYFSRNGLKIVDYAEDADYIIFVTCGVTNVMADICLESIKKFSQLPAELIVSGCLPSIRKELFLHDFKGKVIFVDDLISNPDRVDKLFPMNKIKFKDIEDPSVFENQDDQGNIYQRLKKRINTAQMRKTPSLVNVITFFIPLKLRRYMLGRILGKESVIFHYESFLSQSVENCIRVSWGCTGNCSYCGSKKAMGTYVSKPIDEILKEVEKGLKLGYETCYICSEDIGPYGLDFGSTLPDLLEKIIKIEGDYRIFLGGLNPVWLIKYIDRLENIFKTGKIKYLESPVQSGSARILRLMNRFDDVKKIKDAYLRLKKACPDLLLYPHIMLGFPTENDDDFKKTLSLIKDIGFDSGKIFLCSVIPGTEAENIEPKIKQEVLLERSKLALRFLRKQGYRAFWLNRPIGSGYFYK